MEVRIFICEKNDPRVLRAIDLCPPELNIKFEYGEDEKTDPYNTGIRKLHKDSVDAVVAGAAISLSEFLHEMISIFKTSRKHQLLYSAAPIEPINDEPFLLLDPCVVVNPTSRELVTMAKGAAKLYRNLYIRKDAIVAVLSHATGSYQNHNDQKAMDTVKALSEDEGNLLFTDSILQLDAARSLRVATRKAASLSMRPNVLLCTEIGVANAIYKSLELYGRKSVHLSGAILMGLGKRKVGLLPRTCEVEDVLRLLSILAIATREEGSNE